MSDVELLFFGNRLAFSDEETIDKGIAYLQSLKAYLPAYNSLLAFTKQGTDIKAGPQEEASAPEMNGVQEQEIEANGQPSEGIDWEDEPLPDTPAPLGLTGWLDRAWDELGQPEKGATGEEIFNTLIRVGFVPTAKYPREAIKTALRVNTRFRKVGETDNKAALWRLKPRTEAGPKLPVGITGPPSPGTLVPLLTDLAVETTANRYKGPLQGQNPPRGERVIDYATRAWKAGGRGVTVEELAQMMIDNQNWQSSGDPLRTLKATLRKPRYANVFVRINNLWFLHGEYLDDVPSNQLELNEAAS